MPEADSKACHHPRPLVTAPVEAGITRNVDSYPWSSYTSYITGHSPLTNIDFVLDTLSPDRSTAITQFKQIHFNDPPKDSINTFANPKRHDSQIRSELAEEFNKLEPSAVNGLPKPQRDAVLTFLRTRGFSIRQIERVTGVPRGIVARSR